MSTKKTLIFAPARWLHLAFVFLLCPGLSLGLGVGCSANLKYNYGEEPDPRTGEYVLGPSDGIRISVWKNAELSTDAIVRPDGTVTMPLIGDVRAAGRTTKELREEIIRRLGTYIKSEETPVIVAVTSVNSYRFTVSGNVEHGGPFSPKFYCTVSDAVAMAGGVNKFGNSDKIYIMRTTNGKTRRIPIALTQIQSGARLDMDIVVLSGDSVVVP